MKLNFVLPVICALGSLLVACSKSEPYDASTALSDADVRKCLSLYKSSRAFIEEIENLCVNQSVEASGFVTDYSDKNTTLEVKPMNDQESSVVVILEDSVRQLGSEERAEYYWGFDNYRNSRFKKGDKILVQGRIDSLGTRSMTIKATVVKSTALTEAEQAKIDKKKEQEKLNEEYEQNQKHRKSAVIACASRARVTIPGGDCPSPSAWDSSPSVLGRVVGNQVKLQSMCFFGSKTILYNCTYDIGSGSASVPADFEVY
jgi:hypothetical protein